MIDTMTLRVPEKLKAQLREKAKILGISINALILQILWERYETRGEK